MIENILKEIELKIKMVSSIQTSEDKGVEYPDGEECYKDGVIQGRYEELLWCRNIIHKHMNSGKDMNVTTKDGWIPVEERLPDQKGEYLITYHPCYWDDVEKDVKVGLDTFRGKNSWVKKKYQRVIAGQPLPEPYRKEQE